MTRPQTMLSEANADATNAAEDLVRRYCGWHIAPLIEATIVPRAAEGGVLYLPTMRLVELVGVAIDGAPLPPEQVAEVQWDEAGMLERPGGWPARPRAVSVQVRHGFDFDEVGDVAALIRHAAQRSAVVTNGLQRVQVGNRSTTFAAESGRLHLTSEQRELLAPYVLGRGVR